MNKTLTLTRALRLLAAASLVGFAVVHLRIADSYSGLGDHPFSLGDQFYAQSAAAITIAIGLLVRPHLLVWLAATGLAVTSLAVLVYSRSHTIPVPGFPGGFQESWDADGAKPAAWFESAAILFAGAGSALALLHRKDSASAA